jgi:exonuclease SbcC
MIPVKLTLSGFLSYRDEVVVDFTPFDLACISGANGSGKSSLLDAITWALFGQARTRDDAVINLKSETAEVTFVFSYEGNLYRVMRSKTKDKTSVLEFHIQTAEGEWKALTERTMRSTEAQIVETLRLDYETFVNASFFLQGKADQFTQQRPADRKRILSSILGLEIWESYRKEAYTRRRAMEDEIKGLDGRLQEIQAELSEEDQRAARVAEIKEQMDAIGVALDIQSRLLEEMRRTAALLEERRQAVHALREQIQRTEAELDSQKDRLASRQEEIAGLNELSERAEEIGQQFKTLQEQRTVLAVLDETAARFNEQEKRRHAPLTEIETARTRLETELQNLRSQEAEIQAQANALKEIETALETQQQEVDQLAKALEERDALKLKQQDILQQQAEARAENPRLKAEMEELVERIEQLNTSSGAECPLCSQPLSAEDKSRLVADLTKEGKAKGDRFRANNTLLQSINAQVDEINKALTGYNGIENRVREANRRLDQSNAHRGSILAEAERWQRQGAQQLAEITDRLNKQEFANEARHILAGIDAELKAIGYDAATHDALRHEVDSLSQVEIEFRALETAQAALQPLVREAQDLQKQIDTLSETLKKQSQEYQKAADQLALDDPGPDLAGAEQSVLDLKEQENQARMAMGAAQQNLAVLDTLRERQKELTAERDELSHRVMEYKALERAFGKNGVPAILIEQALPQIASKANEILDRLSAGAMNISFETQQEYKDNKRDDLRETLDILIRDSSGERDYEMYSGGEAFRINFAIRLALSEVLAQRAGARLQTLVIDEGFGSQDEIGRQRLVEAINLVREDFKKILVITHIESLKESFPTRLEVTKGPGGSIVELI